MLSKERFIRAQIRKRKRRLRPRLAAIVPAPLKSPGQNQKKAGRWFLKIMRDIAWLFFGECKMIRLVGPGERPEERYEFESPESCDESRRRVL